MSAWSAQDTYFFKYAIFVSFCLWATTACADEMSILNKITPLISLHDNGSSVDLQSIPQRENQAFSPLETEAAAYAPPLPKSIPGHDLFSLELGARFQISDWLGFGATCSMPLTFEETTAKEDLSVEAMVTMQF